MIKARCPICGRVKEENEPPWPEAPFCSKRCRTIDLGRWLGEEYRIAHGDDSPIDPRGGDDDDIP